MHPMDGDNESAAFVGDIRENSAAAQLVRRLRAVAPQAPQGTHYSNAYWYRVLNGYRFPEWQAVEDFVAPTPLPMSQRVPSAVPRMTGGTQVLRGHPEVL